MSAGRVVITGVGLFAAPGDAAAVMDALDRGVTSVGMHRLPGVEDLREAPAAPAPPAPLDGLLPDPKLAKYMNPTTRMAVCAAGEALHQAGLSGDDARREEMGLFLSAGLIAFDFNQVSRMMEVSRGDNGLDLRRLGAEGLRRCHPLLPFKMLPNMPLGMISIAFGIRGPNAVLYPGVDQAGQGLRTALREMQGGGLRRCLVGATTHGFSLLPLATAMRRGLVAASAGAARPFDPLHRGLAPADAAGFLVFEDEEAARRRGAACLARVIGCEAGLAWEEHEAGRTGTRAAAWNRLCQDAHPDVLFSSGTLDFQGDQAELEAAGQLHGRRVSAVFAPERLLGHQGGAGVPFGAGIAALALSRGYMDWPGLAAAEGSAIRSPGRILLSAADPEGGYAAVLLEGMEGAS